MRIAIALLLVAACGGKPASESTTPTAAAASGDDEPRAQPAGGAMIPPEAIDEINRSLARKRRIVSHCLAEAIDNKELPKNSAGKITLEIIISPNGRAETVNIIRATLESKMLDACVIGKVKETQFPALPRAYETSYTYGFEAM